MKKYLLFLVSLFFSIQIFGKEVTIDQAQQVALSFLKNNSASGLKNATLINLTYAGDIFQNVGISSLKSGSIESKLVYVFKINEDKGFIIISGDDAAIPVLAYSSENINSEKMPSNVLKWLEGYRQQILFIQANNISQTETIRQQWAGISNKLKSAQSSVSPLITTKWNQSPYVNDKCPYDNDYEKLTVTGCPATAMAQIMKYWKYPSKGSGFHSYQHDKYGTLSANFGSTYYDWDSMPDNIDSSNDAVATLMYHCGVAVEMIYNVADEGGSASYVIIDELNRYSETQTVEYALKTYFGYSSSIKGELRSGYSDTDWKNMIKDELNAGRPVQYAGFGQGGHTFVCDGYDDNDYFHMNWGWGGYYDGYFLLDALNPGTGGIGSGAGTYNDGQQALIGIEPPESTSGNFALEIYDDVTASKSTISYGEGFTITTDVANDGTGTFNGDFCAAAFDENDVFVDFIEIKEGWSLEAGYHYTNGISFTTEGSLSLLPGSYRIYIFYRPTDGNWVGMKADFWDFSTKDYTDIQVVHENDIRLYSTIDLLTTAIYSHGTLSVKLDIANYSSTDFTGTFDVSLYNLEGDFVTTVEEKTNMNLESMTHYTNGLTFTSTNINVDPGTYLLALLHKPDGGDYELTGSTSSYINPIKIIIKEPPYEEDIYEDNNSLSEVFALSVNYTDDKSNINTAGSNIHVGSDWDFYSINLEAGYNYTIDARLHDAYDSDNGNTYTIDVLFLYSLDGENWSNGYDDVMPDNISVNGANTLYFVVSPYFLGETGSYLLDINVERTSSTPAEKIADSPFVSVFPNPCVNTLRISANENIVRFNLFDLVGKSVLSEEVNSNTHTTDVSNLNSGTYFMKIETEGETYIEKVIKR